MLVDLGFGQEERQVRKIMAIPSIRQLQTPYEILPPEIQESSFETSLKKIVKEEGLEKLSVDTLVDKLSTTYRSLSRRFTDELQLSPGKWLQKQRLEAAKELLETTALSIGEICYRVGYQDLASFSRLFLRENGVTPGEFRRQVAIVQY